MDDQSLLCCHSTVFHRRYRPVDYAFSHAVFWLWLNIRQVDALRTAGQSNQPSKSVLARLLKKTSLISWSLNDYGFDRSPHLLAGAYIDDLRRRFDVPEPAHVFLLTQPKVWWRGFNPVSFWCLLDQDENLFAVFAEVNNTFGERHVYLVAHNDWRCIKSEDQFYTEKRFHVSPFFEVKGRYRFRFDISKAGLRIHIDYSDTLKDDFDPILTTSVAGQFLPVGSLALWRMALLKPLAGLKVMTLIHWHAFKLWCLRVRFFKKPVRSGTDIDITK
jgi:DUF1365 family protein